LIPLLTSLTCKPLIFAKTKIVLVALVGVIVAVNPVSAIVDEVLVVCVANDAVTSCRSFPPLGAAQLIVPPVVLVSA
jgi:hypothetical protein